MEAQGTIFLSVAALIYTIMLATLFIKKKKINKVENRLFKQLLIFLIIVILNEIAIVFTNGINVVGATIQKVFRTII